MILSEVRTTIRDRLLGLGYEEWLNYGSDNVPETVLERYFHVGVSGGSGTNVAMHTASVVNDVQVTLWRKGFQNAVESQDAGLASVQEVLCDLLAPAQRTLPAYRRIDLSSYALEQIATDNDSICKITINLSVEVILEVTQPL